MLCNVELETKRDFYGKNRLDFTLYNLKIGKTYVFQTESTFCSYLDVKELLSRNRRDV